MWSTISFTSSQYNLAFNFLETGVGNEYLHNVQNTILILCCLKSSTYFCRIVFSTVQHSVINRTVRTDERVIWHTTKSYNIHLYYHQHLVIKITQFLLMLLLPHTNCSVFFDIMCQYYQRKSN